MVPRLQLDEVSSQVGLAREEKRQAMEKEAEVRGNLSTLEEAIAALHSRNSSLIREQEALTQQLEQVSSKRQRCLDRTIEGGTIGTANSTRSGLSLRAPISEQAKAAHRDTRGEVLSLHSRWQRAAKEVEDLRDELNIKERMIEEATGDAAEARALVRLHTRALSTSHCGGAAWHLAAPG